MRSFVYAQQVLIGRGHRSDAREFRIPLDDCRVNGVEAIGALRVTGRPAVLREARIFDNPGCSGGGHPRRW